MSDEGPTRKSADEDPQIKVTDKRMFTPDGRLREEYSFLDEAADPASPAAEPTAGEPPFVEAPSSRGSAPQTTAPQAERQPPPGAPAPEQPSTPPAGSAQATGEATPGESPRRPDLAEFSGPQSVGVMDLVAMLAETAAVYLGDAQLPDGTSGEHLEMARVHIDLLEVLRQKTAGNLSPQESAALEDVLYRLRVRYVQKRG